MTARTKKLVLPVVALALYAAAAILKPDVFTAALNYGKRFLLEMVQVLPAVVILSGLIAVWVPRDFILRSFGQQSGWKGRFFSILLGSVSAGPIYAAFPLCVTLRRKGASIGNIVTIISAWAVIKVPMLLMEIRFLGLRFAAIRYVLTVPAILGIAFLMERFLAGSQEAEVVPEGKSPSVLSVLPGHNCGACGHESCAAFADSVERGENFVTRCVFIKTQGPQRA